MDIRKDAERWAALLGAEIRGALSAYGVQQSEVAEQMGIGEATLSRWLNGHRPMPAWALVAVAWRLGEPISELFARADRRLAAEHAVVDPRGRGPLTIPPPWPGRGTKTETRVARDSQHS
ncbi:MAG: helix-turn-helix domain-containing protein [Bifidobacteriaceae bacterium]|jgi:transcriptional regulator with XRE-family HTH domain|nr:helix-turn-helix domain-containing protein [Bifidobacteriaceae bacterium]